MSPTDEQFKTIARIQSNNPSMLQIEWGYLSDGSISLTIRWKSEPEAFYKSTLNKCGEYVGNGSGPFYDNFKM